MSNASFFVCETNSSIFTNSIQNDVLLYTSSNSQNWRIGSTQNTIAALNITSNAIYTSNVNIGIGTSNPQTPLDVNGNSTLRGSIMLSNSTGFVTFSNNGTSLAFPPGSISTSALNGVLSQWSNNGDAIGITGSNVGIGTNSPLTPLDVNGASIFRGSLSNTGFTYLTGLSNTGAITTTNAIIGSTFSNTGFGVSSTGIITTNAYTYLTGLSNTGTITSTGLITANGGITFSNNTGFVSLSNNSNILINVGGFSNTAEAYFASNVNIAGSLSIGGTNAISTIQPFINYGLLTLTSINSTTISSPTWTTISFSSLISSAGNTGLLYSNGIFTNSTGSAITVIASWSVLWSPNGTGTRLVQLYDGTNTYATIQTDPIQSIDDIQISSSGTIQLTPGGTFVLRAYQTSGSSLNYTSKIQITTLTPNVNLGAGNITSSQPYVAYSAASVTWNNAVWTVCPFNTVSVSQGVTGLVANGSGSFTNTTSATIIASISYSILFPANGTNTRKAAIYDGTNYWGITQIDSFQASDPVQLSSSAVVQITPGMTIQITGYQNSGAALTGGSGTVQFAILSQNIITPPMIPATYTQPVLSYSIATMSVTNSITPTPIIYTTNYSAQGNTGLSYNSGTGVFTNTSGSSVTILISANAYWTALANAGSIRQLNITFNNTVNNVSNTISGTIDSVNGLTNTLTTTVTLAANDNFKLTVLQDTNATTTLQSSSVQISTLGISILSPASYSAPVTYNAPVTINSNLIITDYTYLTGLSNNGSITTTGAITGTTFSNNSFGVSSTGAITTSGSFTCTGNAIVNGNISAGNVGIGTSTPAYPLDVMGAARFSGVLTATGGINSSFRFRCVVFSTSGNTTWTIPSNVYYIKVTGTGGGGGGGGVGTGGTTFGASGGGSGGTQIWYGSVTPNTTFSITVGVGGTGGAKGGNGSGGGASIVYIGAANYIYANGGYGGKTYGTYSAPGSGEVANGASLAQISIPGASSQTMASLGGSGASSIWGGGGMGGNGDISNGGSPGVVYGSGGGGARYDAVGAIGAVGVVIIEY